MVFGATINFPGDMFFRAIQINFIRYIAYFLHKKRSKDIEKKAYEFQKF